MKRMTDERLADISSDWENQGWELPENATFASHHILELLAELKAERKRSSTAIKLLPQSPHTALLVLKGKEVQGKVKLRKALGGDDE